MATINLTRTKGFHKARDVSVAVATVEFGDIPTSADVYEILKLAKNTYVTKAEVLVVTPFDNGTSAVASLGFDGDDTLIDGANLAATAGSVEDAGTNAVVPALKETGGTVTLTPTFVGAAATAGKVMVVVEYIEVDKTNGYMTQFSDSP